MARVILLRQFEDSKGIKYQGDFCDWSLWIQHKFIKPTGLTLNKRVTDFYFQRYCQHFAKEYECTDLSRQLELAFMYCHAAHECKMHLNQVSQIVLEFNDEFIDIYCLFKR